MNKVVLVFSLVCYFLVANAQEGNRIMDHAVFNDWKTIKNVNISNNGDWVSYNIKPHKGDEVLKLYNTRNEKIFTFERAEKAMFDFGNDFICFLIKPHFDSIQNLKRKKLDKDKFPKDTLGFFDFNMQKIIKIPNVESFKMPEEKAALLAYKLSAKTENSDSIKKENEDNGSRLIIRDFKKRKEDTLHYVKDYIWSKPGNCLAANSTGKDSTENESIIIYNSLNEIKSKIWKDKAKASHLKFDESGNHLSFLVDADTTDTKNKPIQLYLWEANNPTAIKIADTKADFLDDDWNLNQHSGPFFSKESKHLFFGISKAPIEQDTSLLEDEIVNVEVWSYEDDRLHTEQNVKLEEDQKQSYTMSYDLKSKLFSKVSDEVFPDIEMSKEQSNFVLKTNFKKYRKTFSWEGITYRDAAIYNLQSDKTIPFAIKEEGNFNISPLGKYVFWYNRPDSCWKAYRIEKNKTKTIADHTLSAFYDEMNDRPMLAGSYGVAGWTEGDKNLIVYDRYDLWLIDPRGKKKGQKLTNGRDSKISYRYIKLDSELDNLPSSTWVLSYFDENDKSSGFVKFNVETKTIKKLVGGDYRYNSRIYKADKSEDLVFTKENFEVFPDLQHSNLSFEKITKISDANPQQDEYRWGTSELVSWTDSRGIAHQGMLIKPDDFDPAKKYPLLVNFYEKSSNGLNRHRAPFAHRSTINYSFYVNRGYVIFNPDVHYDDGYPGKSCYLSVMSGVEHILKEGYIDEARMGLQGHSWGGYQIAHLITKTNKFKCAESGAPVVNMFSAYGGIRWGSGLSRMFQYEHTQSRIGATIWERPDLYKENSPLFNLDKVNTPVLILHNDKDGAVPWYQGIEFFVAMRRLGKPAWLLNYNGEPHWPVKRQNRLDFNKRMQQFFDHYLMDKAMPQWMKKGVPAIEKGILQGFELDK